MAHLQTPGDVPLSGEQSDVSTPTPPANGDLRQSSLDEQQNIFQCEKCSKVFNRRENLSRHIKTHNALPSHICSKCGRGFTRSDLLKRHYVGHGRWDQQPESASSGPRKRRKFPVSSSDTPGSPSQQSESKEPLLQRNQPHGQTMDDSHQGSLSTAYQNIFQSYPSQIPYGITGNSVSGYGQMGPSDNSLMSFDFSDFLLPTELETVGGEWFSYDFYCAMQETGNSWEDNAPERSGDALESRLLTSTEYETNVQEDIQDPAELISRVSSPPNEASEEDKWPFQWNPSSRRILEAQPITIADDHPLLKNHDPRYDISDTTLMRMKSFLILPQGREYHQSQQGIFTLPSLPVLNIFIRLFFQKFSHQMPIIHHSTVNMNTDLPPPLLAAIVVIGASYSHLKHTRRFSIVLLDVVRWHLRIALECDNSLMRDPMIVYAQALICHAGLWNGNKRSFELAEVVRGALVTYIRRLRFGEGLKINTERDNERLNVQDEWRSWIRNEQQKRLAWVVYALDCQFPSILNLPPTISLGEVRDLGCPCDEEFWSATSARHWKNLLGPASVPPSRSFSAAVGPFLILTTLPPGGGSIFGERLVTNGLPILNLNSWSAFLVLMALQHQVFQFHQESMITRSFLDDETDDLNDSEEQSLITMLKGMHTMRRSQIAEALSLFSKSYLLPHRSNFSNTPSSSHFHASTLILHHLSAILLDIPLSDLQSSMGKDGLSGITQGLSNLSAWARRAPFTAQDVVLNAIHSIILLTPHNPSTDTDTAPYSLITVFLCHVVLYVFAQVASREQKNESLKLAAASLEGRGNSFLEVLQRGFGVDGRETEPNFLLRSAAERLTRLGTWGAALNLALMVQKRTEM